MFPPRGTLIARCLQLSAAWLAFWFGAICSWIVFASIESAFDWESLGLLSYVASFLRHLIRGGVPLWLAIGAWLWTGDHIQRDSR